MLKLLAFDYGASSGRAMLGRFNGEKLDISEVHRFPNDPVTVNGSFFWDILRLFHEMKQGIIRCAKNGDADLAGIGVDTWAVDFGLLDVKGELLGNPYHYRDSRTEDMMELAAGRVSKREIYNATGIAFLKFNTLYQLLAMKEQNSPLLEKAQTLLMIPDLLNYFLTGEKVSEYTNVSTTQMMNAGTRDWDRELLVRIGIPDRVLTGIVSAGTLLGKIKPDVAAELNVGQLPVITVAEHDTGSAVASVPASQGKFAYISSGTWSLMGVESMVPVMNETTYNLNYTNEGGINNTYRLLKNIMGLWIFQECKRQWDKTGEALGFGELERLAEGAPPFVSFIDPDDDLFYGPGGMPEKVREYCKQTGQKTPDTKGEIVRCVMESLALKYRVVIEGLEKIIGYFLPVIHVVGGGCQNTMLNRFTANATGKLVITGPVEATAIGNLVAQLMALKEVAGLDEARMVVRKSFPMNEYQPVDTGLWDETYQRFITLIKADVI
jgi:rhamnulokinase